MFRFWLRDLFPAARHPGRRAARRARPQVLSLEDRVNPAPIVTIGNASQFEGNAGTSTMTFNVSLDKADAAAAVVSYATADGTATAADGDYVAAAGTLTIPAGATTGTITVTINGDTKVEADETFSVQLTAVANAQVPAPGAGFGTIQNDDKSTLAVGSPAPVTEGANAVFVVSLSNPVDVPVSVTLNTADGSTTTADYTPEVNTVVTFAPGTTSLNVPVATTGDAVVEPTETFTLTASNVSAGGRNVVLNAPPTGTATITDDDTTTITVASPASTAEGGTLGFVVTSSAAVQGGFSVAMNLTLLGTTSAADISPGMATLTFAGTAGETQTFTVTAVDDAIVEPTETFSVALGTVTPAQAIPAAAFTKGAAATGTITDNDTTTLTVGDVTVPENAGPATFTVTSSAAVQGNFTVGFATSDGTAVAGKNYTATSGTLTFTGAAAGAKQTFAVPVLDDGVATGPLTFLVSLANPAGPTGTTAAQFDATDTATGTITDADPVTLTVSSVSQAENGGPITVTVTSSRAVAGGFRVDFVTADGTATAGSDYTAAGGTLTFAGTAGETKTFTVAITADNTVEAAETFTAALGNLAPLGAAPASAFDISSVGTETILNDDNATVSINTPAAVAEGGTAAFVLTLTNPVDVPVTVTISTGNQGTTTDADHAAFTNQVVLIPANTTTFSVPVATVDDAVVEPTETFTVAINAVGPATRAVTVGAPATGTATITDNDTTTLTVSNPTRAENNGPMLFTVTSPTAVQGGFSVTAKTADGTAVAGKNYTASTATLAFAGTAGEAQTFSVPLLDDGVITPSLTFTAGLSNPAAAQAIAASKFVVTAAGTGTITNVDAVTLTVSSVSQAEDGGPLTVTVTSSRAVAGGFKVDFATADGTATAGGDYTAAAGTLTFAGTAGETQTFTVAVSKDATVEANETFTVGLSNVAPPAGVPASAFDTSSVGTETILNDDNATLSINTPATVVEGGTAAFVLTLTNPVDVPVTVTISTGNQGTTTDADHAAFTNRVVTIPANTLTLAVPVTTVDDAVVEPTETFTVAINAVGPATRAVTVGAPATGTATITDNDTTTLTVSSVTQAEDKGPMTFTVTSSNAVQGGFSFTAKTADGTATVAGKDYTAATATLTFAGTAGEAQTFTVAITADTSVEPDETFTVGLSGVVPPAGVSAAQFTLTSVGTGTIVNDDAAVITVNSPTATEGGQLAFVFTLSNPVDVPVSFDFAPTGGTATQGADYAPIAGQPIQHVTIPAGKTSAAVNVAAVDDRRVEGTEAFTVATSNLSGQGSRPVTLDPTPGVATIFDNDTAALTFSKAADAFPEDNRTTSTDAVLTIAATGTGTVGLDRAVAVTFTPGGTAALGGPGTGVGVGNFLVDSAGFTFNPADGTVFTKTVTVTVFENLTSPGNQTATVTLGVASDGTGGQVTVNPAPQTFTVTIQDDDAPVRTYDATVAGAYRLVRNGPNVELYANNVLVAVDAYGSSPIVLNGTAGDDSLQVDYSGGNPIPAGGVTFDGKAGNDRLTVTGGTFDKISSAFADAASGTLVVTDPALGGTVTYRNLDLETLLDPAGVGEVNFVLPAGGSVASLQDSGGPGDGKAEIAPLNSSFLPLRFVVPTRLVSVDRGNAIDTVQLTAADPAASDITSALRVGTAAAPLRGVTLAGRVASTDFVELNAVNVAVNAPLSATNAVVLVANSATQSAQITTNALRLGVGGPGDYTLNAGNNAQTLSANTTGSVAYLDVDALTLAGVNVGGSFGLTTVGAVTQTATVIVAGPTTLSAGTSPITLENPANDFSTVRVVRGSDAGLADANALVLAGVSVSRDLRVSAGGALTQTGTILAAGGKTTLTTGGDATLTDPANDFGDLAVNAGGRDAVRDANALTLDYAGSASLDVTAQTDLTVNGGVTATAGGVALRAGNNVFAAKGVRLQAASTIAITLTNPAGGRVDLRGADLVAVNSTVEGSAGADTFLLTGTTGPVTVNGNDPTAAPGDVFDFDAEGRPLFAGPNTFNTRGGTVAYVNIETVKLTNATGGVTVFGTNGDDRLVITRTPTGPLRYVLNGGVPVDAVGGGLFTFNGLDGRDALVADYAQGSPVPAGGVLFDGGPGDDVGLCVLGNNGNAVYTTTSGSSGSFAGSVTVDSDAPIRFAGLETTSDVDVTGMASVAVGFFTADDALTIADGTETTTLNKNPAIIVSGPATPRVGLWNDASLTVDTTGTDGNDTVTVASAAGGHRDGNLTIRTGTGNDAVNVTGNVALQGAFLVQTQSASVTNATVAAGSVRVENARTLALTNATLTSGSTVTQAAGGPVALSGSSTVNAANDVEFTGAIDGPGGLTVNSRGATLFDQAVGKATPLATLATDAPGRTEVRAGQVTTSGSQSYGDPVTYTQGGTQFAGTGGTIAFNQTLDPTTAGLDASVGGPNVDVTFAQAVGSRAALGTLAVPDAHNVTASAAVTAAALHQVNGTGTTALNGPVALAGDLAVDRGNVVVLNGPLSAANFRQGAGAATTFNQPVTLSGGLSVAAIGNLTVNAPAALGGDFTVGQANAVALNGTLGAANFRQSGGAVGTTVNAAVTLRGEFIADNVHDLTVTAPGSITATGVYQTGGTGTTKLNGPVTATGTKPVTDFTGGAVNLQTNSAVLASTLSAEQAPVVLRLDGGVTQPAGSIVTKKLYLRETQGKNDFTLNQATNRLTDGRAELFADLSGGNLAVYDSTDLFLGFDDPTRPAVAVTVGNNGNVTLTTNGDFTALDPRAGDKAVAPSSLVPLLDVGGGTVQVFFSVGRPEKTAGHVLFQAEATASKVILGRKIDGTSNLDNVSNDAFVVRPAVGAEVDVNGNSPLGTGNKELVPFDSLQLLLVGINSANLQGSGAGDGTFSFPGSGFKNLVFQSIESIPGSSAEAFAVQTAPRAGSSETSGYAVRVLQRTNGVPGVVNLTGAGIIPNPFVVSPALVDPGAQYTAPKVTVADVNGDGTLDLIIANGAGDAAAITVVDGLALSQATPEHPLQLSDLPPEDILAQFFPFEETFRGGVSVATADFNNDRKLELVVGAGVGGAPRIKVFEIGDKTTFTTDPQTGNRIPVTDPKTGRPLAYSNVHEYAPSTATPGAFNFFAYEPSQRGGVNVAVGDFNGDGTPDIVAGAGFGGGPRVRIIDGKTGLPEDGGGHVIADFFAYDPSFRGGVFVDAGRYDADGLTDLVTAPGAGGGPHVRVFLGTGNGAAPFQGGVVNFFAYDPPAATLPTGLVAAEGAASSYLTGVGGVTFGAAQNPDGGRRSILVTSPRGQQFSVKRFDPPTGDPLASPTPAMDANYQQILAGQVSDNGVVRASSIEGIDFSQLRGGGSAAGASTPTGGT